MGHYLQFTPGALGIHFAVDIENATDIAREYRRRGVPAEIITGDTPSNIRAGLMKKFRNREILVMVSVDVLGEGVDVPAVEVIIWGRPTASFQFYAQGCGRGGRLALTEFQAANWHLYTDQQRLDVIAASPKPYYTIIDPVGNWSRFYDDHGMVCSRQNYVLTRRERKAKEKNGDTIAQRACLKCFLTYESYLPKCPHCKAEHTPQGRTKPSQVDGDMTLLDPEVLAMLRGEADKINTVPNVSNSGPVVANSILKNHRDRARAQIDLRDVMALWAGWQGWSGDSIDSQRTAQRKFFHTFGIDVMTAQGLGARDAYNLETNIRKQLSQHNIVSTTV